LTETRRGRHQFCLRY